MFSSIKIKTKLQLLALFAVAALSGMAVLNSYIAGKKQTLADASEHLAEIERGFSKALMIKSDFIEKPNLQASPQLKTTLALVRDDLTELKQMFTHFDFNQTNTLESLLYDFVELERSFNELAQVYQEYGFSHELGLRKQLRDAAHALEQGSNQLNDLEAKVLVLQIRRSEKDFIIRGDGKYLKKVDDTITSLSAHLARQRGINDTWLTNYQTSFSQLASLYQKLGFKTESGISAQLEGYEDNITGNIERLANELEQLQEHIYKQSSWLLWTVSLALALLLVITLIVIIRSITRTVDAVLNDIEQISTSGDLSRKISVTSQDELASLANSINALLEKFFNVLKTIQYSVEVVNEESAKVANSVTQSTEQLNKQKSEVETVASAVTEMGAVAHDIALNAETTSNRVTTVSQNASDGQLQIQTTVEQMTKLSNQLVDSATEVNLLRDKSNAINAVMEVIRGIAEQTNLLALNAAIEAARAGEQGRGFAVVADEVRSLAVKTQESTAEISQIIADLQASTANIVDSIELCKKQGLQTAEQTQLAGRSFADIIADINEVSEMTSTIAVAVDQQSSVAQEINLNIVHISDYADELAQSSNSNAIASNQVSRQANELSEAIRWFKL